MYWTLNKQYNTRIGIWNLASLRTIFDCGLITCSVDPGLLKQLVRKSLRRLGSVYWHCLAGTTAFPVQVVVKFRIPLIIWGIHQGVDQVGMFSHLDEAEMSEKYRKEHDLPGIEEIRLPKTEDSHFEITSSKNPGESADRYILIGKGFLEKRGLVSSMPDLAGSRS